MILTDLPVKSSFTTEPSWRVYWNFTPFPNMKELNQSLLKFSVQIVSPERSA